MLAQHRDHRRLGLKFHRLWPVVAMAEALASLGEADEVTEIELQAKIHLHLKRQLQQGGLVRQGPKHGTESCGVGASALIALRMTKRQI
jgi:hypothetical protein